MEVTLVVDRSGSMSGIDLEMTNQIDSYVDELPDGTKVNLIQFDGEIEKVLSGFEVGGGDSFMYRLEPRGATALHDAVGTALSDGLKNSTEDKHLFVVVTDGGENSSREFDGPQVKTLVEEVEKRGWEMVYFGANQDAILEAEKFGGSAANSMTYNSTAAGTRAMAESLTASTIRYASGGDVAFTEDERKTTIETR